MIDRFRGQYAFLSSFFPCEISWGGFTYRTLEHAFHAAKTTSAMWETKVRLAATPGDARRVGRKLPLREGWDDMKVSVMHQLLLRKFTSETNIHVLGKLLLDTGELELVEGNDHGDTFWGVCNGVGDNYLGLLLMDVRRQLRCQKLV